MSKRRKGHRRTSATGTKTTRRVHAQSGQVVMLTAEDDEVTRDLIDQLHVQEIATQCRFGLRALDEAAHARRRMSRDRVAGRDGSENEELLWYAIQQLLVAVGNVSKTLTGSASRSRQISTARATRLQADLTIDITTLTWLDRNVRNSFEHFDERLDELYDIDRAVVFDRRICIYDDSDPITMNDSQFVSWRWREYNELTGSASFNNETVDLNAVRTGLLDLLDKTKPVLARRIRGSQSTMAFAHGNTPAALPVLSTTLDITTLQGDPVWSGSAVRRRTT